MRFLVVGGGGREHALAWKLAQEAEVFSAPGNPGCADAGRVLEIPVSDHAALVDACKEHGIDVAVVGPEDPLIDGLADRLREAGISVFGPGADGARLEGSKAWSKEQMMAAGVPTAAYETFTDFDEARDYAQSRMKEGQKVVVKASGAAQGKGVYVCDSEADADGALQRMLVEQHHGDAGGTVVVEDRLQGREFSLLTLVSDGEILTLPAAQDYKRALDGGQGPNTGGMGSCSPAPGLEQGLIDQAEREVVKPMVQHLASQGIGYRGVLFTGLMMHEGRPHCLEYNVRFGDPEIQSVVRRLGEGFADAIAACAHGEPIPKLPVLQEASVTVVLASAGYPGAYEKGHAIDLPQMPEGVVVFHAGTAMLRHRLVTSGGRVMGVSTVGSDLADARQRAYEAAGSIEFAGTMMRRDIAGDQ